MKFYIRFLAAGLRFTSRTQLTNEQADAAILLLLQDYNITAYKIPTG